MFQFCLFVCLMPVASLRSVQPLYLLYRLGKKNVYLFKLLCCCLCCSSDRLDVNICGFTSIYQQQSWLVFTRPETKRGIAFLLLFLYLYLFCLFVCLFSCWSIAASSMCFHFFWFVVIQKGKKMIVNQVALFCVFTSAFVGRRV